MTQEQLAARLGEKQAKISKWENGQRPGLETINAIEDACGRPRGWILVAAGYVEESAVGAAPRRKPVSLRSQVREHEAALAKLQGLIDSAKNTSRTE